MMMAAFALAFWQVDAAATNDLHSIMIAEWIIAVCVLLVVLVILGIAIGALTAVKAMQAEVRDLKAKAMPLIATSHEIAQKAQGLVTDLTPEIKLITTRVAEISTKAKEIAGHAEQMTALAKEKAQEFAPRVTEINETVHKANETAQDVNAKTRQQVDRVNGMVSATLDATAQFGRSLRHGITQPGREIAGVAAGVKTAVQTFFESRRRPPVRPRQQPSGGAGWGASGAGATSAGGYGAEYPPTEATTTNPGGPSATPFASAAARAAREDKLP